MAAPLADRIRPKTLKDVCGQKHILGEGRVLSSIIESGQIPNLIFYGPSGVGKTTVANIIADRCGKRLYHLNATTAGISDIKDIIASLGTIESAGGVLLYLDEIQYFNKKQQQILLSYIESGDITLIASTTENPAFYVYSAVLSRCTVFEFKMLEDSDIAAALVRAAGILGDEQQAQVVFNDGTCEKIARSAAGDLRRALNTLELCVLTAPNTDGEIVIDDALCEQLLKNNSVRYDRAGDEHYDIISAYQKSMRGSDPDAAVYYLARLLAAGDLPSACRRLMACASEDVGLAYPQIIPIVKAAVDTAMMLGLPEAQLPLADAVILVASAPKSNAGYNAVAAATADVQSGIGGAIPRALQNKHYDGAEVEKKGQFYLYPHNYENHYVRQQYLPDNLKNKKYYVPGNNKIEQGFEEYWKRIKKQGG